jgi:hypothetical protein
LHNYTVIPVNIYKAIVSGHFNVGMSGSDYIQVEITDAYKVEISTVDTSNSPIIGAEVIFDTDTLLTDSTGNAIFSRKAPGTYSYTISKEGYDSIPQNFLTVDSASVIELVILNSYGYNVTIIVSDDSGYVSDAAVTLYGPFKKEGASDRNANNRVYTDQYSFGGITKYTGVDGKAVFTGIAPGEYSITVIKSGYIDSTRTIKVINTAVISNIRIILTDLKNSYIPKFFPYPNPTTGSVYFSVPSEWNNTVVSVVDIKGERLFQTVHDNSKGKVISVDMQTFPAGIYMIEIKGNEFKKTWTVLKK